MDIQEYFTKQIENINLEDMVRDAVRNQVKSDICATIKRLTEQEVSEIIKKEVDITLNKPVKTDDGWGKKKDWDSFEQLFKSVFAERLDNSWDMKSLLEKKVKEKVEALIEQNKKEAIDKVVKEITKAQ